MNTTSHSIVQTVSPATTTFSTISLSPDDVANALQSSPEDTAAALRAAVRQGLFSPITAAADDTVAVEVKADGSAEIVVVARIAPVTTITLTPSANAST